MYKKQILKRSFPLYLVMTYLFIVVIFMGVKITNAEEDEQVEKIKKTHIVKEGDTLWDISQEYLEDPFMWPDVWKENKYVINPDLIFPGEPIILPIYEKIVPKPIKEEVVEIVEEKIIEEVVAPVVEEVKPKPKEVVSASILVASGYITQEKLPKECIVGSKEDKTALAEGDTVFISLGKQAVVTPGDEFTVLRPVKKIIHPITKEKLGFLIKILGKIQVSCVQQKSATAKVITSYNYILKGDRVEPLVKSITPLEIEPQKKLEGYCVPEDGEVGYIVGSKDEKISLSGDDIVYIDKGINNGVTPGNHFVIFRENEKLNSSPRCLIGELQVIAVQKITSTARIINSTDVVQVGDKILSR